MNIKHIIPAAALTLVLGLTSCDPSTPKSDFENAGTPISAADLKAALSFEQMPNVEGQVEGDQCIIVTNSRPDIGGAWHFVYNGVEKVFGSDHGTFTCTANGEWQLYYMGISANQVVKTEPFTFTVTNVFDDWSGFFSGAENKADVAAKKVWKFRVNKNCQNTICNNGAYGGWKYDSAGYDSDSDFAWWGQKHAEDAANYSMTFGFDGTLTTTDADGNLKHQGHFDFNHDVPDEKVLGELIVDVPLIGYQWDDCRAHKLGESNVFWILKLTDKEMTLFHPDTYVGGADWDNCGWYLYLQAE